MRRTVILAFLLILAGFTWMTDAEPPGDSPISTSDLVAAVGYDLTTDDIPARRHVKEVESSSSYPGQGLVRVEGHAELRSQSLYPGNGQLFETTSLSAWPQGTPQVDSSRFWPAIPGSYSGGLVSLSTWSTWIQLFDIGGGALATPSGLLVGRDELPVAAVAATDGRLFVPVELLLSH